MTKYYSGDQNEKKFMGDICCTCRGRGEGYTVFWWKNFRERATWNI